MKKINSALISVFYKDGLHEIVKRLHSYGVTIYSTGGTQKFIEDLNIPVISVESLTGFPEILGGRVKTLQPKIFGGILARRANELDQAQMEAYQIPYIDLIIVDLYPFEETVKSGASEEDIIEKIDIGGISLIRAAAKNFNDTLIISSRNQYAAFTELLDTKKGATDITDRKQYAKEAFHRTSHYDAMIHEYFIENNDTAVFKQSIEQAQVLRYGENPHQKGIFYGKLEEVFTKLHGKELSYNNLVDIDAAIQYIAEFEEATFVIIKHTNACGIASASTIKEAYLKALACDSTSAFGGILIANRAIDLETAQEINNLFCEVLLAPTFAPEALQLLQSKKNRVLLQLHPHKFESKMFKSLINGVLVQDCDQEIEKKQSMKSVTNRTATDKEIEDLEFALICAKHLKSNTIAIVKNKQMIGMGCGQTSRVDALKQAIEKAHNFGFDTKDAVMASDAFFPFPDCVEIADNAGITAVVQPGGSIKDQDSIDYCNAHNMAMLTTGVRHFKH
ncbi:MAG: bifunctional phosphoribosylaminoimidazolecarboxamide formyltransferase/IMP cyclohydrolase [Bacteroidota bacterium]